MRNIFEIRDNLHAKDDIPSILKWGVVPKEKVAVSIVMPVYNHPQYFVPALESALNQDFDEPYEIIVVDNNMEDDVAAVNEFEAFVQAKNDPRVLYYKNEHNIEGINNFNRGPQLIHSDYFVFLHDDDELCEDCLSVLFATKKKYNVKDEVIIVPPYAIDKNSEFLKNEIPQIVSRKSPIKKKILECLKVIKVPDYRMNMYDWLLHCYTNGGGCLHSKTAFVAMGGYDAEFIPSGDYALYSAWTYYKGAVYVNSPHYKYRIAENDAQSVFRKTIERDEFFRTCMMDKIPLPNFLLKAIIKARKMQSLSFCEKLWTGESQTKVKWYENKLCSLAYIIKKLWIDIRRKNEIKV